MVASRMKLGTWSSGKTRPGPAPQTPPSLWLRAGGHSSPVTPLASPACFLLLLVGVPGRAREPGPKSDRVRGSLGSPTHTLTCAGAVYTRPRWLESGQEGLWAVNHSASLEVAAEAPRAAL